MLGAMAYMTKDERKQLAEYITDMEAALKVDTDTTFEAMNEKGVNINMAIHFNMMKCEMLIKMGEPIYPFTVDDYARICAPETEEQRRKVLCEVLTEKKINFEKEQKTMENDSKYSETRIGKVLDKEPKPENEPVMDCVKEKDAEVGGIAKDRLRSLIERIERLEEEKKGVSNDIRDVFAEAKSAGFDVKIMRVVLKLRKMSVADREEQELVTDTYCKALDM